MLDIRRGNCTGVLPTRARMTVRRGAAGNEMVTLNSNIWRRSTVKHKEDNLDGKLHEL